MDSIVDFLNRNKLISIEFDTHSDYRGDMSLLIRVTEKRGEILKDWCVYKDIDPKRITYIGNGKRQPIVVDLEIQMKYPFLKLGQLLDEKYIKGLDTKDKQECANKLNRRTEIKIIKAWL